MLPALTSKEKVERLAVLVSGNGVMKLLGVLKLSSGSGKEQAKSVHELIEKWEIADRIQFMSFDTTASNTSVNNGACTLLEEMLGRELLSLACDTTFWNLLLLQCLLRTIQRTEYKTIRKIRQLVE